MNKMSKQKLVTITALLTVLLIPSVYAALMPSAHASEVEIASATTKGLTIIDQVAGFSLANYRATTTLNVSGSYIGVLPTENIRYTLTGFGNTIEIQDTFTNGHLLMMTVLEDSRSTHMPSLPAEIASKFNMFDILVQIAKGFLLNYQDYSSNPFYSQLAATLDNADPAKNSTTTTGNINFEVNTVTSNSPTFGNSTTFKWSYTANGVDAQCKCVSLSYRNGFLYRFFDSWDLYPIGSTTVNLSKQQAEYIAMQNAKGYSWTIGSGDQANVINNFNVTKPMVEQLVFCPAGSGTNARSSYPLTLYPMWSIGVGLDKFYPGNVYGIYVDIWADTGQVRDIQEAYSTLPPPEGAAVATLAESSIKPANNQASDAASGSNMFPDVWVLAAFAVFIMMSVPVWLSRKKSLLHSLRLPKLRTLSGTILCILIGFTVPLAIASVIPTVNAGSALIWGDCSTDPCLPHTPNEIGNQTAISAYITGLFEDSGYAYYQNMQDLARTTPYNVQTYVPYANQYYPPTVNVWFDHGIGMYNYDSQPILNEIPNWQSYPNEFHYMLSGSFAQYLNPSGDVFDYQLYDYSSSQKNCFSFISACLSANLTVQTGSGNYGDNPSPQGSGYPIGMPYAWTHRLTSTNPNSNEMSLYGYAFPDPGAYCYIGFPWGSAPLSQTAPPIDPQFPNVYFCQFVSNFFFAALSLHDSVNQALDYASGICWSKDFQHTVLYNGFSAYWEGVNPPGEGMNGSTMTVFGNGDMYLYPGTPDYISLPSINHNVPYPGVTNQQYQFSASATDPCGYSLTYEFNYGDGSGWTSQTTHTYTSPNVYTVTARAHSSTGLTRDSQTIVTIGNMLTVQATLGGWIELHPNVAVDSNPVGTAAVHVPVISGSHTVYVDSWIPCPGIPGAYCTFSCFIDSNYNYYYNGQSIPVTSPNVVTGYYNLGW